ncbi:unnamed protein product [Sphenostylis stenocarpa]|uniref:AP2/ERF domain-containing protein n=1 Tax=Sphenostylis stenocarpa TaxID=92480 RepID=A0AA86VUU3_9FABA|nr:unnamed protein product [Sphenostylis stenocarpa]
MTRVDSSSSSSLTSCNDSFSTNNSSGCKMYKGVRKRKWGKWVSEIRLPNSRERIWLGSYDTQEKAARAFDAALFCLRGKDASFNFSDTPHHLEIDSIKTPRSHQDIQEMAAKFAKEMGSLTGEEDGEHGAQSESESKSNHSTDTNTNTSFPIFDGGTNHHVQVDLETMDWTFMNMLDDLNGGSDFDLYFGADKGEFFCPTTQTPLLFHHVDEIEGGNDHDHDAFSNHSFLWSWNF